jgi:A/G-specific adenine glycosylase
MEKNTPRLIQEKLQHWYESNARDLPWRRTKDPYQTWVSEIMLQQTRVETVIPYFERWMEIFPTIDSLASAEEDQVLSAWEGLGYYSRARNLHRTARILKANFQGKLPSDPGSLQKLPGIGRYTAGAIASIAYGLNVPVLDGNVRRVFTRYFNVETPLQTAETETKLWQTAQELLPKEKTGDHNQALMELGALICLPKNPLCRECPLSNGCLAKKLNLQKSRPVRKKKSPLPHLQVTSAVFQEGNLVLLAKRPPDGLLGGMWEYPGGKQELNESLPETLNREIQEELNVDIQVGEPLGIFHHAYTHYKVTLHAYYCSLASRDIQLHFHTAYAWVPLDSLPNYPMGKLDRLISQKLHSMA